MGQEKVWKPGPTMRSIYVSLRRSLYIIQKCPDNYLDSATLHHAGVLHEEWDLNDTDEFFRCMTEEAFDALQPVDPPEPFTPYDQVEVPDLDPPRNIFDLDYCAREIEAWFHELQRRKVAEDGHGGVWPEKPGFWVPRVRRSYEKLYQGNPLAPQVRSYLCRPMTNTSKKPHQIYHAVHGDEAKEGLLLRSELKIFMETMKGRMERAEFSTHLVPIMLLSIHGTKARIMIANFNQNTMQLHVKYSRFEQFSGFEEVKGPGNIQHRATPDDFNAIRDLFFRWLNPTCQGETFLEDSKNATEMVMRGPKGRKRLVKRGASSGSTSTASFES